MYTATDRTTLNQCLEPTGDEMASRILVVDDERVITDVVEEYLRHAGYEVAVAGDGIDAMNLVREWGPDLVVLDLMLPGLDGLEVCRRIRIESSVPIIMLTARGDETDRIVGLELGADDYVAKPFSPRELVARVRSVLRRVQQPSIPDDKRIIRIEDLSVNSKKREVVVRGMEANLTAKEFDLLYFLASHAGQVFSRGQLMDQVWDYHYEGDYSTVTVHIRRLREKIEADPERPRYIKTVWGVGYKLEA